MRPEVKAFKNELRNYRYYQERVRSLTDSIEECYYQLSGLKGVDPSRIPMHTAPNLEFQYKIRDSISRYEAERSRLASEIEYVDEILSRIETSLKQAVINVYINGESIEAIANQMFLSHNGLYKRMNQAIKEALK